MGKKEQKFKTRTGYCHILPDMIILSKTGVIGNLDDIKYKENSATILILYGVLAAGLLFTGYTNYLAGQNITALIFGGFGLMLINGIIRSLNFSGTPLIPRADIKEVVYKKGVWGLSGSRFEILFTNEKGKTRKRLIMLSGPFKPDEENTAKAIQIMKNSGLLNLEKET
ncbi:MAG: hypothetical protein JKY52_02600 [Flavobacteriales bacterium]|nr:hypothetical protein [Flavobacteriales bacterium]